LAPVIMPPPSSVWNLLVEVARENIKRNKLEGKIQLLKAGAETDKRLSEKNFDLIIANLFYQELRRLRDYLFEHLNPDGFCRTRKISFRFMKSWL